MVITKELFASYLNCQTKAYLKNLAMPLICVGSLIAALPGAVASQEWGWLVMALVVATLGWGIEQWKLPAAKSS